MQDTVVEPPPTRCTILDNVLKIVYCLKVTKEKPVKQFLKTKFARVGAVTFATGVATCVVVSSGEAEAAGIVIGLLGFTMLFSAACDHLGIPCGALGIDR
jgi:putative effector of murein hydrolase